MKDDSIDGIFSTLKDCAMISKWAGGIGLHAHNIRAKISLEEQMVYLTVLFPGYVFLIILQLEAC